MADITIKKLNNLTELEAVKQLEEHVWKSDIIPVHQTLTAAKNGGIILGGYDGDRLVGFNYGFPGFKNGKIYLCSHTTGIHSDYRRQGIGYALKVRQRDEALAQGYKLITWTFDPLESVNATLNLTKLNGIGASYVENLYGELDDALNNGLPTDRFLVEWWIDSPHVREKGRVQDQSPLLAGLKQQAGFPALDDRDGGPLDQSDSWLVPLPTMFQKIKKEAPDLAKDWRMKTRAHFQRLIANGFVAAEILKGQDPNVCHYLFVKRSQLNL
ncbi:putative GNAT superfamily acetyltransferase [Scopulibacillus darangshiensis]|uniref:Putative GNAT superfamily acetyltransferase n=1 Tax=Scopulibacillus darangshiensis TaxID=442528 RepID=A0A4R2PAH2_9BACL|nr:GNAT family N-acetyltransferase [Scopulibacillus darangshiensis]TCP31274.1 putative GNAT superfamily acetyltransferase [Scopulibacillus darangshiensis]